MVWLCALQLGENIERLGSNVLKSTTELLSSVTEAIEAVEDEEGQLQKSKYRRPMTLGDGASGSAKYNRFEAQVRGAATLIPSPTTATTTMLVVASSP